LAAKKATRVEGYNDEEFLLIDYYTLFLHSFSRKLILIHPKKPLNKIFVPPSKGKLLPKPPDKITYKRNESLVVPA